MLPGILLMVCTRNSADPERILKSRLVTNGLREDRERDPSKNQDGSHPSSGRIQWLEKYIPRVVRNPPPPSASLLKNPASTLAPRLLIWSAINYDWLSEWSASQRIEKGNEITFNYLIQLSITIVWLDEIEILHPAKQKLGVRIKDQDGRGTRVTRSKKGKIKEEEEEEEGEDNKCNNRNDDGHCHCGHPFELLI